MPMQKQIDLDVTITKPLWPYKVINEIQKVMEQGDRDGKNGWEEHFISYHIHCAEDHLAAYFTKPCDDEDHLAHAFTRLMMAIAIERGYVKENKNHA